MYKIFRNKFIYYFSFVFVIFYQINLFSQSDSLEFKNGNIMDGEIKSLERGVVVVSTDYSDSDFKIEWDQIRHIETESFFFIPCMTITAKHISN